MTLIHLDRDYKWALNCEFDHHHQKLLQEVYEDDQKLWTLARLKIDIRQDWPSLPLDKLNKSRKVCHKPICRVVNLIVQ
uniref:Uncharacterized protein n=1 Tax=Anopheles minimus TaxID=112268 RepID=A0A182WMV3_9DIPT